MLTTTKVTEGSLNFPDDYNTLWLIYITAKISFFFDVAFLRLYEGMSSQTGGKNKENNQLGTNIVSMYYEILRTNIESNVWQS